MEEQKTIKDYIVDYLLDGEDEKRLDPVLVEWLAEDESHRKEFNLYKKIWEESHRYTEVEAFDPDLAWEKVDKINRQKVYLRKYWKNMLYTASGVAGALVKLNAGSEVVYSYDPKKKTREVDFQGEGFFDVSKSKDPFVIKVAGGLNVRVWGTSFNLQAYADDPVIQASLVGGCIELEKGIYGRYVSVGCL